MLSERAYRAAALNACTLNVLSLLTAYQAELCREFAKTRDSMVFADVSAITDLCLCTQRSAVQVAGKIMVSMVLQERTCMTY